MKTLPLILALFLFTLITSCNKTHDGIGKAAGLNKLAFKLLYPNPADSVALNRAGALLDSALLLDQECKLCVANKIRYLSLKGNDTASLRWVSARAAAHPDDGNLVALKGILLKRLGQNEESALLLREAISLLCKQYEKTKDPIILADVMVNTWRLEGRSAALALLQNERNKFPESGSGDLLNTLEDILQNTSESSLFQY